MFFNNLNKEVDIFAKKKGYSGAKYIGKWKEYKVYEPHLDGNQVSYIGLPLVILVNNTGEIRMSTSDEAMATLDGKSFIESFEENKNNEELNFSNRHEATAAYMEKFGGFPFMAFKGLPDTFVIEKVKIALKNNKEIPIYYYDDDGGEFIEIDETANKTTEQDAKKFIDYIDDKIAELKLDKSKIDEEIEKNLDEVSKYSILNKTLDELLSAKKKFINDWDVLTFNTISEHWVMNGATYRVHIVSIIDAILRRIDDSVSKQQLELLNSITENKYFENQDRDSVIKIIKNLKELEYLK